MHGSFYYVRRTVRDCPAERGAPALLTKRWCDGDVAVVDAVLFRYGPEFARRLRQRYPGALALDEAEEIVSYAVEHAWQRRGEYDPRKGPLPGWLWRIARRAAADTIRSGWCRERCEEESLSPDKLMLLPAPLDGEPVADDDSQSQLAQLAAQILSEIEFAIVWADACSPDGVAPSAELSEQLGICASTIRSHRARARRKLASALPSYGYGQPRRPR